MIAINKEIYMVELFFFKRGDILLQEDVESHLPQVVSDWSNSPEDTAILFSDNQLGIQIDQFDYPLGFRSVIFQGLEIISYSLVPSMWREVNTKDNLSWNNPLRLPENITLDSRDTTNSYFRRFEEELLHGSMKLKHAV